MHTVRSTFRGLTLIALSAVCAFGDAKTIGYLSLETDFASTQTVTFYNLTGNLFAPGPGCGVTSSYDVCTAVNLVSEKLTIYYTDIGGPTHSTFTTADLVGPYDSAVGPYNGGSQTWQIPFDPFTVPITQIVFVGTIQPTDTQFRIGNYAGATPYDPNDSSSYVVFNAQSSFTATWDNPAPWGSSDVSVDAAQASIATVPEPATFWTAGAAALATILRGRFAK